jgi:putative hemolysin
MTPAPDMVAIQADTTVSQLRALFREQEYSRFPVYQENLDNILGIIRVKDLLKVDGSASDDRPITSLIRPTTFVPRPSACRSCSRNSSASRCRWRSSSTSTAAPRAS